MKHVVISTALVLALGIGVGNAQTSTAPPPSAPPSPAIQMPSAGQSQPGQAVNLSRSQIEQIQENLKGAGLYNGSIDGDMGPVTKRAIMQFQQQKGMNATGVVDEETLEALNQGGAASPSTGAAQPSPTNRPATPGASPPAPAAPPPGSSPPQR